jgi:hypothetical protein
LKLVTLRKKRCWILKLILHGPASLNPYIHKPQTDRFQIQFDLLMSYVRSLNLKLLQLMCIHASKFDQVTERWSKFLISPSNLPLDAQKM